MITTKQKNTPIYQFWAIEKGSNAADFVINARDEKTAERLLYGLPWWEDYEIENQGYARDQLGYFFPEGIKPA